MAFRGSSSRNSTYLGTLNPAMPLTSSPPTSPGPLGRTPATLRAWILLVGPHDDQDPILNVYAELYRLLDAEPKPDAGRAKPPCCDEIQDLPPVLEEAVVEILDRAVKLRKTRQAR